METDNQPLVVISEYDTAFFVVPLPANDVRTVSCSCNWIIFHNLYEPSNQIWQRLIHRPTPASSLHVAAYDLTWMVSVSHAQGTCSNIPKLRNSNLSCDVWIFLSAYLKSDSMTKAEG